MALTSRVASTDDAALLGGLNHQLIADEGHRNPMTPPELTARMRGWLESGEYRAVLWEDAQGVAAYALYRENDDEVHLRQFFVARDRRREGIGRRAMAELFSGYWPRDKRRTVSVLVRNAAGVEFWRAMGYEDYDLTLEILPPGRAID
jgi:GNAT superfamily N-acetyltransferase